jgi:hypothetical protein
MIMRFERSISRLFTNVLRPYHNASPDIIDRLKSRVLLIEEDPSREHPSLPGELSPGDGDQAQELAGPPNRDSLSSG